MDRHTVDSAVLLKPVHVLLLTVTTHNLEDKYLNFLNTKYWYQVFTYYLNTTFRVSI